MLVNSNGKDIRVEFNGGSARNNGHGSFITSDPTTQKAIEKDRRFGTFDTGSIYLYEAIGSEDGNKAEAEAKAENVKQEPAKVNYRSQHRRKRKATNEISGSKKAPD